MQIQDLGMRKFRFGKHGQRCRVKTEYDDFKIIESKLCDCVTLYMLTWLRCPPVNFLPVHTFYVHKYLELRIR
jgi:hypothetical protein